MVDSRDALASDEERPQAAEFCVDRNFGVREARELARAYKPRLFFRSYAGPLLSWAPTLRILGPPKKVGPIPIVAILAYVAVGSHPENSKLAPGVGPSPRLAGMARAI